MHFRLKSIACQAEFPGDYPGAALPGMCASVRDVRPNPLPKLVLAFVMAAGFLLAPGAARAVETPALRPMQPPYFNADISVTIDTLAHPSVNVTITVPYSELNWNRVPAGYAAGVGFTVELQPSRGEQLYGSSWEKRLTPRGTQATVARPG